MYASAFEHLRKMTRLPIPRQATPVCTTDGVQVAEAINWLARFRIPERHLSE